MAKTAAIDLGFGWTKAQTAAQNWRQPSVLGEPRPLFDESRRATDVVYKGPEGEYFVGDLALRQSAVHYMSTKDRKAETWTSEILMKTALAFLEVNEQEPCNLVAGLPVDFYFTQAKEYRAMLENLNNAAQYTVEQGRNTIIRNIPAIQQVKMVPQPLGAAMDYLLDDKGNLREDHKEDASKRILVLDWGHYTVDLLPLDSMEIMPGACSPAGLGVDAVYKLLAQYIRADLGRAPARWEMENAVRTGQWDNVDVRRYVERAYKAVAVQVMMEVESLNMTFHKILIAGGAAEVPFINEYLPLPNKAILPEPQLAIVRGYRKIGERAWHA